MSSKSFRFTGEIVVPSWAVALHSLHDSSGVEHIKHPSKSDEHIFTKDELLSEEDACNAFDYLKHQGLIEETDESNTYQISSKGFEVANKRELDRRQISAKMLSILLATAGFFIAGFSFAIQFPSGPMVKILYVVTITVVATMIILNSRYLMRELYIPN